MIGRCASDGFHSRCPQHQRKVSPFCSLHFRRPRNCKPLRSAEPWRSTRGSGEPSSFYFRVQIDGWLDNGRSAVSSKFTKNQKPQVCTDSYSQPIDRHTLSKTRCIEKHNYCIAVNPCSHQWNRCPQNGFLHRVLLPCILMPGEIERNASSTSRWTTARGDSSSFT